jgi:hypothetical protein
LSGGFPAELFRVTGDPSAVRGSAQGWLEFGSQACEAADDIRSFDTSLFVGPEADLYREGLDADLVPHLERTGQAYSKVGGALAQFAADLAEAQDVMAPLTVRAPNVWELLQVSHANLLAAQSADTAHREAVAAAKAAVTPDEVLPADGYVSDTSYATVR